MEKFKRYSKKEKEMMVRLYKAYKSYIKAADEFGCAMSTIYYAVNKEAYERHKEHVYEKSSH